MRRAIELLPPELKPFFEHFKRGTGPARRTIPTCGATCRGTTIRITSSTSASPSTASHPFSDCRATTARALEKFGAANAEAQRGCCRGARRGDVGNLRRGFEGMGTSGAVLDLRRHAVLGRRPRTTSRMRTSRFTPPTTTTASRPATTASTPGSNAISIEKFESRLRLTPAAAQADRQCARRGVRRAARELPARRPDPRRPTRRRSAPRTPTTTSTSRSSSPRCSRCSSSSCRRRSPRPRA